MPHCVLFGFQYFMSESKGFANFKQDFASKAHSCSLTIDHECIQLWAKGLMLILIVTGGDTAESVCEDSGHWSQVQLACGGSMASGDTGNNVYYAREGSRSQQHPANVRKRDPI